MLHNQTDDREVARSAYFSNAGEPAITFKRGVIRFNAVCLKRLPNVNDILFVIHRAERKLTIEPCDPDEQDAIRWSGWNPEKRKPRSITCSEFYQRMLNYMQWDSSCNYKLFGKTSYGADNRIIIAFDLTSAIIYKPDENGIISRTPEYSRDWGGGFGRTVEQHKSNPFFRRFTEDTEISIVQEKPPIETEEANENEQQL